MLTETFLIDLFSFEKGSSLKMFLSLCRRRGRRKDRIGQRRFPGGHGGHVSPSSSSSSSWKQQLCLRPPASVSQVFLNLSCLCDAQAEPMLQLFAGAPLRFIWASAMFQLNASGWVFSSGFWFWMTDLAADPADPLCSCWPAAGQIHTSNPRETANTQHTSPPSDPQIKTPRL